MTRRFLVGRQSADFRVDGERNKGIVRQVKKGGFEISCDRRVNTFHIGRTLVSH